MRMCTAKASRISRETVKSGCAREWGGWGRLSEDGPGQNNPDRSEGPWGRAAGSARTEGLISASIPDTEQGIHRWQQRARRTMANQCAGKASFESPALKPYRGKPAVRNFREGNGNVGIIRSPVRAIALPDSRLLGDEAFRAFVWRRRTGPTSLASRRFPTEGGRGGADLCYRHWRRRKWWSTTTSRHA